MLKRLRANILALTIVACSVPWAHAGVIFNLTPTTLSTVPGGTIEFIGTLTNSGAADVFLNGDVSILPNTLLTLDDSPFFINSPLFLMPSQSYVGPFFDVAADAGALSGIYSGSFTIQGGADSNTFDNLASQSFTVNVISSVPEPNYSMLSAFALAMIVVLSFIPRPSRKSPARPSD